MTRRLRLGFLTHVEGNEDPGRIYQETIELFVAADQLGFDSGWVAQHHFRIHPGRLPSPFPFLAAVAQRTKQIRLGTALVVLPLENPLRVAEDAAVVDLLSGGRLELGVGSGAEAGEFQAFGLDLAQRRELNSAALKKLQQTLRGELLNDSGQRLDPPAPTLVERLWQGAASPIGVQYIAQQETALLLSRSAWTSGKPTDELQLPLAEAYLAAWQAPFAPRIGLSRGVYPAADKQTALAGLQNGVLRACEEPVRRGLLPAGQSLEYYAQQMHVAYGHPEEVAATLAADRVLPLANELIIQFNPVSPPLAQAIHMLETVAREVAPKLGWQPASSPQTVRNQASARTM